MLPRPLQTKGIKAIWEAQPMRNMRLLLNFNSGSNIHRRGPRAHYKDWKLLCYWAERALLNPWLMDNKVNYIY